jgi:hypothetical protein
LRAAESVRDETTLVQARQPLEVGDRGREDDRPSPVDERREKDLRCSEPHAARAADERNLGDAHLVFETWGTLTSFSKPGGRSPRFRNLGTLTSFSGLTDSVNEVNVPTFPHPVLLVMFLWYFNRQDTLAERQMQNDLIKTILQQQTAVLEVLKDALIVKKETPTVAPSANPEKVGSK